MDFHGFSWIFMDSHGFSWIFMDSHGFSCFLYTTDLEPMVFRTHNCLMDLKKLKKHVCFFLCGWPLSQIYTYALSKFDIKCASHLGVIIKHEGGSRPPGPRRFGFSPRPPGLRTTTTSTTKVVVNLQTSLTSACPHPRD